MGNIIVKSNSLTLNTDTELGKFIYQWALNDYTIHPHASLNFPKKFKDILKKRACCTYKPTVSIGIAGIDDKNTVNANKILQYKIDIAPFLGDDGLPSASGDVINAKNCTINDDTGPNQSFLDNDTKNKTANVNSTQACKTFYDKGDNNEPGFGQYVLRNRTNNDEFPPDLTGIKIVTDPNKLYTHPLGDQINGLTPNASDPGIQGNNNGQLNPYSDCNCVNSIYAVHKELFLSANGSAPNPEMLAQTNDGKCTKTNSAWKGQNASDGTKICFNLANTGNISADDSGNVKLTQSCSIDAAAPPTTGIPTGGTTAPDKASQVIINKVTPLDIVAQAKADKASADKAAADKAIADQAAQAAADLADKATADKLAADQAAKIAADKAAQAIINKVSPSDQAVLDQAAKAAADQAIKATADKAKADQAAKTAVDEASKAAAAQAIADQAKLIANQSKPATNNAPASNQSAPATNNAPASNQVTSVTVTDTTYSSFNMGAGFLYYCCLCIIIIASIVFLSGSKKTKIE